MIDGKYYEKESIDIMLDKLDKKDRDLMKIIKMFITSMVIIIGILGSVMCCFTYYYFTSDYDYMTNTINGDNNSAVSDNKMDNSDIDN